jgi:hypothetical protein
MFDTSDGRRYRACAIWQQFERIDPDEAIREARYGVQATSDGPPDVACAPGVHEIPLVR